MIRAYTSILCAVLLYVGVVSIGRCVLIDMSDLAPMIRGLLPIL